MYGEIVKTKNLRRFASKVFPAEKKQKLPLQFGCGDGRF